MSAAIAAVLAEEDPRRAVVVINSHPSLPLVQVLREGKPGVSPRILDSVLTAEEAGAGVAASPPSLKPYTGTVLRLHKRLAQMDAPQRPRRASMANNPYGSRRRSLLQAAGTRAPPRPPPRAPSFVTSRREELLAGMVVPVTDEEVELVLGGSPGSPPSPFKPPPPSKDSWLLQLDNTPYKRHQGEVRCLSPPGDAPGRPATAAPSREAPLEVRPPRRPASAAHRARPTPPHRHRRNSQRVGGHPDAGASPRYRQRRPTRRAASTQAEDAALTHHVVQGVGIFRGALRLPQGSRLQGVSYTDLKRSVWDENVRPEASRVSPRPAVPTPRDQAYADVRAGASASVLATVDKNRVKATAGDAVRKLAVYMQREQHRQSVIAAGGKPGASPRPKAPSTTITRRFARRATQAGTPVRLDGNTFGYTHRATPAPPKRPPALAEAAKRGWASLQRVVSPPVVRSRPVASPSDMDLEELAASAAVPPDMFKAAKSVVDAHMAAIVANHRNASRVWALASEAATPPK